MDDRELDLKIDEIQERITGVSADARNVLHACRPNHPLGKGRSQSELFHDAAFVLSGRSGVDIRDVEWLKKMADQTEAV